MSGPLAVTGTRLYVRVALYASAGTLLFLVERLLPNPFPWIRLGLANVVTLFVLLAHGTRAAAAVLALRLLLGGFFAGTLFGPQFLLAASGGLASLLVMSIASRVGSRTLSALGISALGSCAHAGTQIVVVAVAFAAGRGILTMLPLFLALALLTGSLVGLLGNVLVSRVELAARQP
jgi:heptaprenyl diphosphate synthase